MMTSIISVENVKLITYKIVLLGNRGDLAIFLFCQISCDEEQ